MTRKDFEELANTLQAGNPRFNRERFLIACKRPDEWFGSFLNKAGQ